MQINCSHQLFNISSALANLLISLGFTVTEKDQSFGLTETLLLQTFFKIVLISKPTHCYVFVTGSHKKYRINYKFYTKPKIANYCVSLFLNQFEVFKNGLIIEPSAGNGSFLESLNNIDCKKCYLDIFPEDKQILQPDFLKYSVTKKKGKIHVIGNPPFGRQSSMAIKFIKHAASFADSISFILPKSFKKDSLKNRIPLNFHLQYQIDLSKDIFFCW